MPDQEFEYDVFLSHAGEDTAWCETLAECLRNEGVLVWFDKWELQPGDNLLARINDSLAKSRKMIAVWSANYFRDGKVWTLVESFSQLHGDPLSQDRPIIPLLIEDCTILPTFRNILFIDFRNKPDFDLRFRQLLQALDLAKNEFDRDPDFEFKEHDFEAAKRGRFAQKKGKRFEDEIAKLYELLGFSVKRDTQLHGFQIDLQIEKRDGGLLTQAIIECKDKRLTADDRNQILAQQNVVQKKLPRFRWIAVSSQNFAADTRIALEEAGVDCTTYAELLRELVPLDQYNEHLIAEYETWVAENWRGEDWYIRPHLLTDITYEKQPALTHFAKWLGDSRSNFLVVLGDLGTGKSTLARFLAYNLAKSFASDPLRHPAPVLIHLKEVRKENTLESMIISHFSKAGLSGINFPRFEHLVRLGKIILLFDAFDEMADRVRWEVTKSNFTELRRAFDPGSAGKVILTCRTHYFKDRKEQVKFIGQGPRLSEIETELYRELRQQSNAEVVYLQEFNDEQIQAYLHKARPQAAPEDWQKIQSVYNLKELAQRPLLLEMIVKSLPRLAAGQTINAANLYTVYTNIWVEREEQKGRILDKQIKLQLMLELAWRLWHEEKDSIHYRELAPFVEKLIMAKVMEFGDEQAEDIAREMQTATFLKRDDNGNFSFVHRSFMEYFLARKLYNEFDLIVRQSIISNFKFLETQRLERKIIYFITLLDKEDQIFNPLQNLLKEHYYPQISENALQILYWSGRVKCGMEEKIDSLQNLRDALHNRIPEKVQMASANLQDIVLEAACFKNAQFSSADLTRANLNHVKFEQVNLQRANLSEVRAESIIANKVDFQQAKLNGTSFTNGNFDECDFRNAEYSQNSFIFSNMHNCKIPTRKLESIKFNPTVKYNRPMGVFTIAFSCNNDLLAWGGDKNIIMIQTLSRNEILNVIEGHKGIIRSLSFSSRGITIASGSTDKTVRIWEVKSGKMLFNLEGHKGGIWSIYFSPDGNVLASGSSDRCVNLWDVNSGKTLHSFVEYHNDYVTAVHISPDGNSLATGSADNKIFICELSGGKMPKILEGHKNAVSSLQFSPSGNTLVSGGFDANVHIWNVQHGNMLFTLEGHQNHVHSVCFSPNGYLIASGSEDNTVRLWDAKSGECLTVLENHLGPVYTACFAPNGKYLVAAGAAGRLQFWDHEKGETFLYRYAFGPGAWLDLLPDGRFNASPEGMRYLCYTEQGTFNSYTAEELVKEFYDPQAVQEVLDKYVK